MSGSTDKVSVHDELTDDRSVVGRLCACFAASGALLLVIDEQGALLASSRPAHVEFDLLVRDGWLNPDQQPRLAAAVRAVLVARVRQVVELDRLSSVGPYGLWAAECFSLELAPTSSSAQANSAQPVTLPPVSGARPASGSGRGLVGVLINAQPELLALRQRAEQTTRSESLGLLAGSIAHDFNNLLTGIRGSLALVRHHVSQEGRDAALGAADAAARRAGEVTRRLLTFARGPERIGTHTDARLVLQETLDLMQCMPDATRVEAEIEPDLGCVEMLPSELHQVVLNLLINASDAVRSQGEVCGVALRAGTTWRTVPGGRRARSPWLRISVIDQGPGMEPAVRSRIFEPFFTTKAMDAGNGLGLCSVKELVERAGGWLEVESELAKGSAFHVYLPLSLDELGAEAEQHAVAEVVAPPRVLICDDEARLGELTVGLLGEFGFPASSVLSGDEAFAELTSHRPPVALLLDVHLSGGMPASELLERLQARGIDVPVVLTSGLAREDLPPAIRLHPRVVDYLAKPYTVEQLVSVISSALAQRRG